MMKDDDLNGTELTIKTKLSTPPPYNINTNNHVRMASHNHRILIYTTCYNVLDGVTLTIRKIEQEILASGGNVCVVTTKSGDPKNTNIIGTHDRRQVFFVDNSIEIPFLKDSHNPDLTYHLGFSLSESLTEKINDYEPSLIHITVPDPLGLSLIEYARQKELPLMGTYHSNIPEYLTHYPLVSWLKPLVATFFKHQYNFYQHLYVPTPFIHNYLSKTYNMDRVTSLRVWGRGIDLDKFSPSHRSAKFRSSILGELSDDTPIILWVGRIVPEKRPDIFVSVCKKLHDRGVKYHALIIGAGPAEDEMKSIPNSTFVGWLSSDELPIVYASSDVFLFPSAVETFGNVTLEAAACGLPLVVEAGCSGHLVEHGKNGSACTAGEEGEFFDGTFQLVNDIERRRSYSEYSRNNVAVNYEKRTVVQQMIQNYTTVTDEFYCMYGGHHRNRDIQYKNDPDYSFTGGNHPRPLQLAIVEVMLVKAIQFIFFFIAMFTWVYHLIVPVRQQASTETQGKTIAQPKNTIANLTKNLNSKNNNSSNSNSRSKNTTITLKMKPSDDDTDSNNNNSATVKSAQKEQSQDDSCNIVDVDLDENNNNSGSGSSKNNNGSPMLVEDEDTVTTVSSIGDGSATTSSSSSSSCVSVVMNNAAATCNIAGAAAARKKLSDIPELLAVAFVNLIIFNCRMESNARNMLHDYYHNRNNDNGTNSGGGGGDFHGRRKRKNSNMILRGGEDEEDSGNSRNSSPSRRNRRINRTRSNSSDSESSPFFKELGGGVDNNITNIQKHRRHHHHHHQQQQQQQAPNRMRLSNNVDGIITSSTCTPNLIPTNDDELLQQPYISMEQV